MPRKPLYYDSENGKKEVLGTSGSFEQVPDAPSSALPTEYPATYAAMQTSITSDSTTKRDFFVSADETNGGVYTRYFYDGSVARQHPFIVIDAFDALTDAPVIQWSWSANNRTKKVVLAGKRSLAIEGTTDGDTGLIAVIQDGTGSRTLWLPGVVESGFALSTTANTLDILAFVNVNGVLYWSVKKLGVPVASIQYLTWAYINSQVSEANKGIYKSALTDTFDGFARSTEQIGTGKYLQFREGAGVATKQLACGFTTATTPTNTNQIAFGIYLFNDGNVYKLEGNTSAIIGTYVAYDHFRVFYDGTFIRYQKSTDGYTWTTLATSGLTPSGNYYACATLGTRGGAFINVHKSI